MNESNNHPSNGVALVAILGIVVCGIAGLVAANIDWWVNLILSR